MNVGWLGQPDPTHHGCGLCLADLFQVRVGFGLECCVMVLHVEPNRPFATPSGKSLINLNFMRHSSHDEANK